MPSFPPLFLSHGAPNMALKSSPVREFLLNLANQYQKPDAIVAVSAHFETKGAVVVTDPKPEMIYDFRGFEAELYETQYPAPGEPELAEEIVGLLQSADIPVNADPKRGYDHGTWVPLSLVYPSADIPIVQVSIDPEEGPDYHYKLGKALATLPARNIAVIGTGNITHNLRALFSGDKDPETANSIKQWVAEFLAWLDSELESGNPDKLLNYREEAPYAEENHPTDEHFLPIFVAMGAAGKKYEAEKIHASYEFEFLAMDAWQFTAA